MLVQSASLVPLGMRRPAIASPRCPPLNLSFHHVLPRPLPPAVSDDDQPCRRGVPGQDGHQAGALAPGREQRDGPVPAAQHGQGGDRLPVGGAGGGQAGAGAVAEQAAGDKPHHKPSGAQDGAREGAGQVAGDPACESGCRSCRIIMTGLQAWLESAVSKKDYDVLLACSS